MTILSKAMSVLMFHTNMNKMLKRLLQMKKRTRRPLQQFYTFWHRHEIDKVDLNITVYSELWTVVICREARSIMSEDCHNSLSWNYYSVELFFDKHNQWPTGSKPPNTRASNKTLSFQIVYEHSFLSTHRQVRNEYRDNRSGALSSWWASLNAEGVARREVRWMNSR